MHLEDDGFSYLSIKIFIFFLGSFENTLS